VESGEHEFMQRIAQIATSGPVAHESNSSKAHAQGERALLSSGTALKSTPELLRFVDFLARYEARQTVAAVNHLDAAHKAKE
jgi:hypothetical protein